MKKRAIIYLLWEKNIRVLQQFIQRHPAITILTLGNYLSEPTRNQLAAQGTEVVLLDGLLSDYERHELQHVLAEKLDALQLARDDAEFKARCEACGVPEVAFGEVLSRAAHETWPMVLTVLASLNKARDLFDIELCILNEDVTALGKPIALWANGQQIPTIHLCHSLGLLGPATIHRQFNTGIVAVFGERGAAGLIDAGLPGDRIRMTGNPGWDHYPAMLSQRGKLRAELAQRHGFDADLPLLVFGTTWAANLTAASDEEIFANSLQMFARACDSLRERGLQFVAVIKDRVGNAYSGLERVQQTLRQVGSDIAHYVYTTEPPDAWVVSADAVIACDSNLLIEAMLCDVSAVNILNFTGLRLAGPAFDADSGVLEVAPDELPEQLLRLMADPAIAERQRAKYAIQRPRYNLANDGQAAERVVALMSECVAKADKRYVWQQYLDVEEIDATGYHEGARGDLVAMFTNQPRFVLDIGCAAGGTGRVLKQQYPQAQVWGIETNRAAAEVAATRLDKVLVGKFEEFDLEAEGIAKGSLDGVIVADVLEHMYNPWKVMELLRPFLAPHAQVIASIPNVRNLALMSDLANGHWRYEALGLLDITHIRFFTYKEVERFFRETGYRVARTTYGIDSRLRQLFEQHKDHCPATIDTGKMVLRDVSIEDLHELCSLQFYVVAVPEDSDYQYSGELDSAEVRHRRHLNLLEQHQLTYAEAQQFELRMAQWPSHPLFHVAVIVTPGTEQLLGQTVQSLASQGYYRVKVSILSGSAAPDDFVSNDRIEWQQATGPVFETLNRLFAESTADWLLVLNAGDVVARQSLLFVAEQAHQHPDWRLVYSDEDLLGQNRQPAQPYFKPDFSPDLLRGYPYVGALVWVAKPLFNRLLGFDIAAAGAEFYDLQLRTLEVFGADSIGHIADVLLHRWPTNRYDDLPTAQIVNANATVLQGHLQRCGSAAQIEPGMVPGSQRVCYQLRGTPLVSIIIPTLDHVELLRRCLETLLEVTDYPHFELLVIDTGSQEPEALRYLQGLEALASDSVRVYTLPDPFNFARVMNLAAEQAQGEYLLLLNNDTAPLSADWLREMLGYAQRPDVGVVGPRLLKPDGTVQQAGLVLGLLGAAETPWLGLPHDSLADNGQAQLVQNVSAVSGSCLLIRKTVYRQVGGMNEAMSIGYSDVDLCLKVRQLGLLVVYTPFASLLHEGGATLRDPDLAGDIGAIVEADRRELHLRWLPQLARDPYYNTNLSLNEYGCQIETRAGLTWDPLSWKPLPRILAHPADNQGCGNYRIIQPLSRAVETGLIEATHSFSYYTPVEMERFEIDTWLLQRQLMPHQTELIRRYKELHKCLLVFELDDLTTNLPMKSLHREHIPKEIRKWLREAVALCDRFIVSTEPLAEAYRDLSGDIRVVKNAIDTRLWGELTPLRRQGRKPRVGWAGGASHTGDLEMIADVVATLADEVEWVFMGMCPDKLRPFVKEFHSGVAIDRYPAALAALNLDLALAPLEINHFNECKSNLRLLEYGVLGYPVIATDITPYQGDFPVTLVKNRSRDWVNAIREQLADRDALDARGDALRQYVLDNWALENHLQEWMAAWFR